MCPAWGSVLMFLQGRWEQRYKTFPTLSEGWEPVIPGKRAERRVSGARVVREGFLEMVSLKRSTEKSQMVPARQNTHGDRANQAGDKDEGEKLGERLRALWCVVGTVPLENLPIVSCTWDRGLCCPGTVLLGCGFLVPSDSLILVQERADLNLGWI